MPIALAARGDWWTTARPSSTISPSSGCTAPVRILTNVDLPAPFSPTRACTSPARNSNDAPASACTPAYAFVTFEARSAITMSTLECRGEPTIHIDDLAGRLAEVTRYEGPDRPHLALEGDWLSG